MHQRRWTGERELAAVPPTAWTKADGPLIAGAVDTHEQAGYPTLFHAGSHLPDPIAEWYLYWSGHDGGGIRLHVAEDILGPWRAHGVVFDADDAIPASDHVASPSAIWDPDRDRLNLYYHRGYNPGGGYRQDTALAVSSDGESFDLRGPVIVAPMDGSWDARERSYFRVVRIGGTFVGVYQGRDRGGNDPGIGYAWSRDGVDWHTLAHPLFYNRHVSGADPRTFRHGSPSLTTFDRSLYVLEARRVDDRRELYAVRFEGPDAPHGGQCCVLAPTEPWEDDGLEAPVVQRVDDRYYLFYNSVDSKTNRRQIGVAYAPVPRAC